MLKVQKKDGSLQDFDSSKISGALVRVGLSAEEAAAMAGDVQSWAESAAGDGTITSAEIREKLLATLSPEMVEEYKSFQK